MKQKFPTDRKAKRQALLTAVDSVRDILAANANEAETQRTLPQATVAALRESGLFALKTPTVLGGAETDPVTQVEVTEAVSSMVSDSTYELQHSHQRPMANLLRMDQGWSATSRNCGLPLNGDQHE